MNKNVVKHGIITKLLLCHLFTLAKESLLMLYASKFVIGHYQESYENRDN